MYTVDGQAVQDADLGTSASAKFKTANDQIMRGYYVGYYPFDASYEDPGAIPVKGGKRIEIPYTSELTDNATLEAANLKYAGENSFAYTAPTKLEPGAQVTYLPMKQLTGLIRLNVSTADNYTQNNDPNYSANIKTVILRTQGNDLFTVGGTLKSPAAAPAASNINVTEQTGVLTVAYPYTGTGSNEKSIYLPKETKGEFNAYFPVLPTTLNGGIDVILINKDGWACVLDKELSGSANIESGRVYTLAVTVDKDTKFDHRFVTSQAELQEAIDDAKIATAHTTIELLGDVETDGLNVNEPTNSWKNGVTITGAAGSKLVLKNADFSLHNATETENWNAIFNIDVTTEIEGGEFMGTVNLNGETTFKGDVKVGHATSASDFYAGLLNINANATIAKDAKLNAVYSYGITIAKGATLTVAKGAEFINNNWKFDATGNTQYKSDLNIYGELIVDGTFTDKGDTKIEGGKLTINGEATNQNKLTGTNAAIVVNGTWRNMKGNSETNELTNNGYVSILSGTIDIAEEGNIYNEAELNCAGAFVNDGTFYDYVGSVYGGVPYTSNGTYAAYVNSDKRLAEAYNRLKLYADGKKQTIILQEKDASTSENEYYALTDEAAKTVDFQNENDITLQSANNAIQKIKSLTVNSGEVTINGDMLINSEEAITIKGVKDHPAKLTFKNNIDVRANGAIENNAYGVFDLEPAETDKDIPAVVYCKSVNATVGTWNNLPLIVANGSFWNATEWAK